jgi:sulfur-oxidizing protein SoxZ
LFTPVPAPRVQVPRAVAKDELFAVKTVISHPMETGLRRDDKGNPIARNIINAFVCRYNGAVVFSVDLHEAMAANPYIEFYLRAIESGRLEFVWREDGGRVFSLQHHLEVT